MKKVVIAGGTGFIGQYLKSKYEQLSYRVIIISRQPQHIQWEQRDKIIEALEDADLLINLAGRSVDCRYNERNRRIIIKSRTSTTKILGDAVMDCSSPPKLWLNSSTATIYRHAEDKPMTEAHGEIGSGFSVNVAQAWEKAFFSYQLPHTRQVALRISIVLGSSGGVTGIFKKLTQLGLGGKQGNGKQMFSWIHIEDLYRIISFIEEHQVISGVINCASPYPVTNEQLMKTLRSTLHVPFGIPTPAWLLELGAVFIRTETELILKSRWVIPERLLQHQYQFKYEKLKDALQDILRK